VKASNDSGIASLVAYMEKVGVHFSPIELNDSYIIMVECVLVTCSRTRMLLLLRSPRPLSWNGKNGMGVIRRQGRAQGEGEKRRWR